MENAKIFLNVCQQLRFSQVEWCSNQKTHLSSFFLKAFLFCPLWCFTVGAKLIKWTTTQLNVSLQFNAIYFLHFFSAGVKCRKPQIDTRTGIRSHLSGVFQQPASELDIGGEIKRRQQLPLTIATSRSGYSYNGKGWIFFQWPQWPHRWMSTILITSAPFL